MRRIVVCLLIAFASAAVAARESKLSDADGGGCQTHRPRQATVRAVDRDAATPVPVTRAKATSRGGGGDDGGRIQSPRWHRFLPGMFR